MDSNKGSNIKQKERIGEDSTNEDIFCYPVGKRRSEEQANLRRQKEFPGLDNDLKNILRRTGGRLVNSEEVIPTAAAGDAETFTSEELKQMNSRRRDNYSWR